MLRLSRVHDFTLAPGSLPWPWVAFSPQRTAFVVPAGPKALAIHQLASLGDVRHLELPEGLALPTERPDSAATSSRQGGVHALALHPDGRTVVGFGWRDEGPAAFVARAGEPPELVDLTPALGAHGPMAATFSRDGATLWVSTESASGAALLRLGFPGLALEARATFSPPPPPAAHELWLHPTEDAAVLTMACGQDGTFIQVARMSDGKLGLMVTEGESGLEPCGLAEASADGTTLCLVMADRVELRRWPDLVPVAQLEVPEALVANYCGVRAGGRLLISASDQEDAHERALVLSETLSLEDDAPALPGMWAGRLGLDRLVAVSRDQGPLRRGFVYAIEV